MRINVELRRTKFKGGYVWCMDLDPIPRWLMTELDDLWHDGHKWEVASSGFTAGSSTNDAASMLLWLVERAAEKVPDGS